MELDVHHLHSWPALPFDAWRDTCTTLHLWSQIVGKIRLATTPWLNHSWHVALYVDATGLNTSPMPRDGGSFELRFDFVDQVLACEVSDGRRESIPLAQQTVAQFKASTLGMLADLGITVTIRDLPCEIAGATPFSLDHATRAYDGDAARRFHQVLVEVDRVFKQFRTGFLGKSSPVHFFWGSFDLAVTRFSGRRAPLFQGTAPGLAPAVMQEAYSHEVSSAGFWPGGPDTEASFYSYAYPEPPGFKDAPVAPGETRYSEALREFLLPYETVRRSSDPEATLLTFLQSTYEAAANAAQWDRTALECGPGRARVCRPVS
jgi:Family of unknown function (DUF5996)